LKSSKKSSKKLEKEVVALKAFKALMKKNAGKHRFEGLDEGLQPTKNPAGAR
jgi:hypothetical protein